MYTYVDMQKLLVMAVSWGGESGVRRRVRRWSRGGGQEVAWGGGQEVGWGRR